MRRYALPVGALSLAAVAAAWPYLAFPAVLVVLLATIVTPLWRRAVGIGGGLLAVVALVRFAVEIAVPNIVGSGQRAAEEKAVSRLREIRWAAIKMHTDGKWPTLAELSRRVMLSAPLTVIDADTFLCEGYFYAVEQHGSGIAGVAWPQRVGQTGVRAIVIDDADHICITAGAARARPTAQQAIDDAGICGHGTEAAAWIDWRAHRSRGRL